MKKNIFVFVLLNSCLLALSSQSLVQKSTSSDVPIVQEELLQDEAAESLFTSQDWFALHNLSGGEYWAVFLRLLSDESSRNELQPYALAECLWFECFAKKNEPTEPNEDFTAISDLVFDFLEKIDTGEVPPHEKSDTVYSIFKCLASLKPCPEDFSSPPSLQIFAMESLFSPPSKEIRSVNMYRGLVALERLALTDRGDLPQDSSVAFGIEHIVSNPPLLYVLLKDDSLDDTVQQNVKDSLETLPKNSIPKFYLCQNLLDACKKTSVRYGFVLTDILPSFSCSVVKSVMEDDFVLWCLPEQEVNRFYGDISCVQEFVPIYFNRLVEALNE